MAYTQGDLDSVKAARVALAKGDRVVSATVGGRTTQYAASSDAELERLEHRIQAQLDAGDTTKRRFFVVRTSKGL